MPRFPGAAARGIAMSMNRREFLAPVPRPAACSRVRLIELAQARSPEGAQLQRWAADRRKCKGCAPVSCLSCGEWRHRPRPPATDAQWIRKVTLQDKQTGHVQTLPLMCQHCEHPPCVDVCPTGASFRRIDGIVLVDKHICIGCRYCMMACPYKARSFIHEDTTGQKAHAPRGKGTVESCTLCVHKVDRGDGTTACAEACRKAGHQAILFGDLKDPASEISKRLANQPSQQLRADLKLNTGVRFQGL
jgi:molybdopterin-containing oxidoreductase family iron-sulfur binding subunit